MKREEPISEKDCRTRQKASYLLSVVALLSIQRTPLIYPVVHEAYRRALLRRFPFAIFFEIDETSDRCVVYSVFHCAQDPEKWRGRLPR